MGAAPGRELNGASRGTQGRRADCGRGRSARRARLHPWLRELEERIAWHPLFDPPGAQRFIDDPRIARRLAQARAEAEPMDRARQIEGLALELLGPGPVARILALHHGNAAMKATTHTKGAPQ